MITLAKGFITIAAAFHRVKSSIHSQNGSHFQNTVLPILSNVFMTFAWYGHLAIAVGVFVPFAVY